MIGTLASRETGAVDVVSGDRDMLQLVRDDGPVRVLYAAEKMRAYGVAEVAAKYGIPGTGYAEYAVLRGDPSDGLPGVKGVGDKTAAALVGRFGTVEGILAAARRGRAGRLPGRAPAPSSRRRATTSPWPRRSPGWCATCRSPSSTTRSPAPRATRSGCSSCPTAGG